MKPLLLTPWLCLIATVCIGATLPTFSGRFYGNGGGLTNVPSTNVIYASRAGCVLNSSPTGGGTDDTTALQAALDHAIGGRPTEVIVDGWAMVSGLCIRGNTKLSSTPNGGLFLKGASNRPLLFNELSGTNFTATNIVVEGLTLCCNGENQDETIPGSHGADQFMWNCGILFTGVRGLKIRDCVVTNSRFFAFTFDNIDDVLIENCRTWWTNWLSPTHDGQDGFHFWASTNVVLRNIGGNGAQDVFAFNTDEGSEVAINNFRFKTNGTGGVTQNVLVDGATWLGATNSIGSFRVAGNGSTNAILKNATFRNLKNLYAQESAANLHVENLTFDGWQWWINDQLVGDITAGAFALNDFSAFNGNNLAFRNIDCFYFGPTGNWWLFMLNNTMTNVSFSGINFANPLLGPNVNIIQFADNGGNAVNPCLQVSGVCAQKVANIVLGGGAIGSVCLSGAVIKEAGNGTSGTFSSVTNIGVLVVP